jgi:hypothetical protein
MTTDQKLAHVRWYIEQVKKSSVKETKLNYICRGSGALGAWYADMTISHEQFNTLNKELDIEFQKTLEV